MPTFDFVLAGRYRLIAPLGEGGMAAVYRGRDLRLNREVAIKILRDELTQDSEFLARFEREAQVVASLSHPNIVPVYDVGEERGTSFIVMEYVRGRTLKEAIEREGKLPCDRAGDIMKHVLDALGYAHQQGLVHRDVKPQNILLAAGGTPRLADFGIAHLTDASATRTAAILGSAQYLSPEQSRGEEATIRSDIYACGIVLYEMLTGTPPFDGVNALAIANKHLHAAPPAIRDSVPEIDEDLEQVVMRALAKDPDERFESAAAFASALDEQSSCQGQTSFQPLAPLPRPNTPALHEDVAPPLPQPPGRRHHDVIVVRRSARKAYLLAGVFLIVLAASTYVLSLPTWRWSPPAYPSAPYALFPISLAAIALLSWLNARSWTYQMDGDAAVVQRSLLSHHRFGIPLTQITTLELRQSPIDRLLGVGTVALSARDTYGNERYLVMEDVPHPRETYEDLTRLLGRAARARSGGAGTGDV